MKLADVMAGTGEVFTHFDPETGQQRSFAIEALTAHCQAHLQPALVVTDRADAEYMLEHRGIERHRLDRLTPAVCLALPVLMCAMPDGSHLCVDGSHRMVKIVLEYGSEQMLAYLIPQEIWDRFLIEDVPATPPDALLKSPSNLT